MTVAELMDICAHQGESVSLDYKACQYDLSHDQHIKGKPGSHDDRAELIEDVLALANADIDVPAHIIIGVAEKPTKDGGVIKGIAAKSVVDDAQFQDLVNRKANRPIRFSVETISEVPDAEHCVQVVTVLPSPSHRPFFLRESFHGAPANVVIRRQGSQKVIVSPSDLIAEAVALEKKSWVPNVTFGVSADGLDRLPEEIIVFDLRRYVPPPPPPSPSFTKSAQGLFDDVNPFLRQLRAKPIVIPLMPGELTDEERAKWLKDCLNVAGLNVAVWNDSAVTVEEWGVLTELATGVDVADIDDSFEGRFDARSPFGLSGIQSLKRRIRQPINPGMGSSQAKSVYLRAKHSGCVKIEVSVTAKNMPVKTDFYEFVLKLFPLCLDDDTIKLVYRKLKGVDEFAQLRKMLLTLYAKGYDLSDPHIGKLISEALSRDKVRLERR